jgi:hypothetical protein
MSLLRTLTKAGIATKVINEVRKPKNQAKIKRFVSDVTAKRRAKARAR